MLCFMTLIVFCQLDSWDFTDEPKHAFSGNLGKSLWVVKENKASPQSLVYVAKNGLIPIDLPKNTEYFIPHPHEAGFFTVQDGTVFHWSKSGVVFQAKPLGHIDLPKNHLPFWKPGYFLDGTFFLPDKDCMQIWKPEPEALQAIPFKINDIRSQPMTYKEQYLQVKKTAGSVWWQAGSSLFQFDGKGARAVPMPEISEMGRAAPLILEDQVDWFIFDGKHGNLKSFGWNIEHGPAQVKGILTRLAQDQGMGRLCFTTVSSQVSSHLFASITGKKEFTSWVCEFIGGQWKITYKKSFGLKKATGLFGIFWPGDINADGLLDMIISDKSGGFRCYLSQKGQGYSKKPVTLSESLPIRLISLDEGFAWVAPKGRHWNLFRIKRI